MFQLLIVDDDPGLLKALPETVRLNIPNTEVDVVTSGREAVDRAKERPYDAVVCDLCMPGMTGIDVVQALASMGSETPVLLLTAHPEPERAYAESDAFGYIRKPIERRDFLSTLRRVMNTTRLRRRAKRVVEEARRHGDRVHAWLDGPAVRSLQTAACRSGSPERRSGHGDYGR